MQGVEGEVVTELLAPARAAASTMDEVIQGTISERRSLLYLQVSAVVLSSCPKGRAVLCSLTQQDENTAKFSDALMKKASLITFS